MDLTADVGCEILWRKTGEVARHTPATLRPQRGTTLKSNAANEFPPTLWIHQ